MTTNDVGTIDRPRETGNRLFGCHHGPTFLNKSKGKQLEMKRMHRVQFSADRQMVFDLAAVVSAELLSGVLRITLTNGEFEISRADYPQQADQLWADITGEAAPDGVGKDADG